MMVFSSFGGGDTRRGVASRSPTRAPGGVEPGAGGRDVVLHGDGLDSADHLDEVVNPGEDAVAVVLCHVAGKTTAAETTKIVMVTGTSGIG